MEKAYVKDLVSVVINTFNHVSFIESCVKSVISQSYTNIEIIITDDGSTDGSQELLKNIEKEDRRIRILFSEKNKGMSSNLNKGLVECNGEYFILIAGDDQMLPGKIETQMACLKNNPNVAICLHDMEVFDSITNERLYDFNSVNAAPNNFEEHLFYTNWFFSKPIVKCIPSSIMARTFYFTSHLWDERLKYANELLHGLLIYGQNPSLKFIFIPKVLGRYRIHANNVSRSEGIYKYGLEEVFVAYNIAAIRYPAIGSMCKSHLDYILFQNLLYNWFPENMKKNYKKYFIAHAGLLKYLYLILCKFLLRINILYVIFKPIRIVYKLRNSK